MLKRLQQKQSTFDVVKWHKEENNRKKILSNIKDYREQDVRRH
jgi:predicted transcriptional regulator